MDIEHPKKHPYSRATVHTTTYPCEDGYLVSVPDNKAEDVMARLAEVHDVEYDDDGTLVTKKTKETSETKETKDDDGPTCAGTTADGDSCQTSVDEAGDYCWRHQDQKEDSE